MNPIVKGFFDHDTWTVTYVVYEKPGSPCAIIDSVLDYDPKAEAMLVQKVMKGGAGVWGPVPMPANNISEADAKTLVKWVMSQK